MQIIGYSFVIAGITFCCLLSVLLWKFSDRGGVEQRLLAIIVFIIGWYAFTYLLVARGWFIHCPYVFRLGMPFYYLVPPFAFFYSQLVLKNQTNIKKKVYLFHTIPFLIALSDLIYYYIKNYGRFHDIAKQVLLNPVSSYFVGSGFIPALNHYLYRPIQGCLYLILIGFAFYKSAKSNQISTVSKQSLRWLYILNGFLAINYISTFYSTFISPTDNFPILGTNLAFAFFVVICFFILSIGPFFTPLLIYSGERHVGSNTSIVSSSSANEQITTNKTALLSNERMLEIAACMDQVMTEEQLFKKINNVGELARRLNLPLRYVAQVLREHYTLDFNDYINLFRVKYILSLIESDQYRGLTLEAMAQEGGFSSPTAFFTAFTKLMGVTPAQYLNQRPS